MIARRFFLLGVLLMLTGCADLTDTKTPAPKAALKLENAAFADLTGWAADDHLAALRAFDKSCARLLKADATKTITVADRTMTVQDWQKICAARPDPVTATAAAARAYFEQNFTPVMATADGRADGLFTGYYEASLRGSYARTGAYQVPLRRRPDDLVEVNLGDFRPDWKGQRIAGRVRDGKLKPYEDRAAIVAGKLPAGSDNPIVYVDSAVDAFFLQIQGSGIVTLPDGSTVRLGYDGQNGHPYVAIGKKLVETGAMTKEQVSMQSIRAWLAAHPDQAVAMMNANPSYVFFRTLDDIDASSGPLGGEGVSLTPGRSLAVDRTIIPYGLPIWLAADHPVDGGSKIHRLVIAQDTGGAITGPVRGDLFWGYGPEAEHAAGLMKSNGRYWFLLPKQG